MVVKLSEETLKTVHRYSFHDSSDAEDIHRIVKSKLCSLSDDAANSIDSLSVYNDDDSLFQDTTKDNFSRQLSSDEDDNDCQCAIRMVRPNSFALKKVFACFMNDVKKTESDFIHADIKFITSKPIIALRCWNVVVMGGSRTDRKGFASVRYRNCFGSWKCIFFQLFREENRVSFDRNGICLYCSASTCIQHFSVRQKQMFTIMVCITVRLDVVGKHRFGERGNFV